MFTIGELQEKTEDLHHELDQEKSKNLELEHVLKEKEKLGKNIEISC